METGTKALKFVCMIFAIARIRSSDAHSKFEQKNEMKLLKRTNTLLELRDTRQYTVVMIAPRKFQLTS